MCPQIGEMELDCPGCCGKSYKCRKTLKQHLLHLLDKLRCPQCNQKFTDLLTLANHLDECGIAQVIEETGENASAVVHDENQVSTNRESVTFYADHETISEAEAICSPILELQPSELGHSIELHNEKSGEVPQSSNMEELGLNVLIKNELAESTNLQEQQLTLLDNDGQSHILIMSQDGTLQEQGVVTVQNDNGTISFSTPMREDPEYITDGNHNQNETKDSDDEIEIYSCNTCGISFTSVHEHIQEFHSDQDVVVEVAEAVAENKDGHKDLSSMSLQQLLMQENTETNSQPNLKPTSDFQEQQIDSDDQDKGIRRVITESGRIVETEFKNGKVPFNVSKANDEVDSKCRRSTLPATFLEQQCVDKGGRIYTRRLVQIEKFWEEKELAKVETSQEIQIEETTEEESDILGDGESGVTTVYHCALCYTQHLTMAEFDTHVCKQPIADSNKFTNANIRVFSCDQCSVTYSSLKSLCAHKKVHKKIKATDGKHSNAKSEEWPSQSILGPFKCGACDTVFPTNKSLRLHRRMHDPVKMRTIEAPVEYPASLDCEPTVRDPLDKYHCNICDKWIHVGYQRIHDKFHSSTQDYNCDICNRKFYTPENLVMHMNVHNTEKVQPQKSDKLLPYNCLYCPRQFSRPHEKVKHERIHTGEKPHSCEICGKSFRVSYCLTLHMRTHTGARPYVCSHCGKRFKAHSVYNHHLLTHSEVRAYKCPYCPKAFKTSVQLAGHKNSHTKPFSCTECNRPFASLYAVRVHTETHKRQNNLKFSCEMCGASYARAFALKDHIRATHSQQHPYVQLVEVELERDALDEENDATLSIMPKTENNTTETEELILAPNEDQEMELLQ